MGLDHSDTAIAHSREIYIGPAAPTYVQADLTIAENIPAADLGVCFEVLEHISGAELVLRAATTRLPRLMLSVPNPLAGGSHINPHHVNDWPLSSLKQMLRRAGGHHIRAYHQSLRGCVVRRTAALWDGTWLLDVRF